MKRQKYFRVTLVPGYGDCESMLSTYRRIFGDRLVATVAVTGYGPVAKTPPGKRWLVYLVAHECAPSEGNAHDLGVGGRAFLVSGDLKALKRHYPDTYADLKRRGWLVPNKGRKLP